MSFFCSEEIAQRININNDNTIYLNFFNQKKTYSIKIVNITIGTIVFSCKNLNLLTDLIVGQNNNLFFSLNNKTFYENAEGFICCNIINEENIYIYTLIKTIKESK